MAYPFGKRKKWDGAETISIVKEEKVKDVYGDSDEVYIAHIFSDNTVRVENPNVAWDYYEYENVGLYRKVWVEDF